MEPYISQVKLARVGEENNFFLINKFSFFREIDKMRGTTRAHLFGYTRASALVTSTSVFAVHVSFSLLIVGSAQTNNTKITNYT